MAGQRDVRRLQIDYEFMTSEGRWKLRSYFSGPKFTKFWDDVVTLRSFQRRFPIVNIVFLAGDIGPQSCPWDANSSKIGSLWPLDFLGGGNTQKSLGSVQWC